MDTLLNQSLRKLHRQVVWSDLQNSQMLLGFAGMWAFLDAKNPGSARVFLETKVGLTAPAAQLLAGRLQDTLQAYRSSKRAVEQKCMAAKPPGEFTRQQAADLIRQFQADIAAAFKSLSDEFLRDLSTSDLELLRAWLKTNQRPKEGFTSLDLERLATDPSIRHDLVFDWLCNASERKPRLVESYVRDVTWHPNGVVTEVITRSTPRSPE
jgi:hypothetical protein